MDPDRSWMWERFNGRGGLRQEFVDNVQSFIGYALTNVGTGSKIKCPCANCENRYFKDSETVTKHIYNKGFTKGYTLWYFHGERKHGLNAGTSRTTASSGSDNPYVEMVFDAFGHQFERSDNDTFPSDCLDDLPNHNVKEFYSSLKDAEEPLWTGNNKHTVLSVTSQLLNQKCEGHVSAHVFDQWLKTTKDILPEYNNMPKNYYHVKKKMKKLGLGYVKIDSCINNCMLYYKEDMHRTVCRICGHGRFKVAPSGRNKGIPYTVLRYLPITPRLQRLYMSSKTAPHMTWHYQRHSEDGKAAHPSDSEAWKHFSRTHEDFASEPRNVRLGLCTDGFTPFNHYGAQYSCWPVILTVYNLPPWMCMKEPYMFLNMIIPGPKDPGKDIDVFLRPLVDELLNLWVSGVDTFDASRRQNFTLRVALLWTISDLPAYAMLSGWGTQGKLACPYCMESSGAFSLRYGGKSSHFDCHRKFLPPFHIFREQTNQFRKGVVVEEGPPPVLSSEEIFSRVSSLPNVTFGRQHKLDRIDGYGTTHHWRKKSIFWELPYWRTSLIRHNLDVMHVEKNVFENIFNTVMDVKGKTKDNAKARLDLAVLCNRPELELEDRSGKKYKPKADYALSKDQQRAVFKWLKEMKLPDGYGSNISRCVNVEELKCTGLKSHDCHVMLQALLPIAFRDMIPNAIWEVLTEMTYFFKDVCSQVVDVGQMRELGKQIVETICKLEKNFPPGFFDISEHLLVHLPLEAELGGPVQYRWMYPFERFLHSLKKKVGNKAHVEASICEAYLIQETSTFCSFYFESNVPTKVNRVPRNDDGCEVPGDERLSVFRHPLRAFGPIEVGLRMTSSIAKVAHTYILLNTPKIVPYLREFEGAMVRLHPRITTTQLDKLLYSDFAEWFRNYVGRSRSCVDRRIFQIGMGPKPLVKLYKWCFTNGFNFHTAEYGQNKSRANSGICIKGNCCGGIDSDYYGLLEEIWELVYLGSSNYAFLFKCHWYDTTTKMRVHPRLGLVELDSRSRYPTEEPFVLASQAQQVFYLSYPARHRDRNGWWAVCKGKSKSRYAVSSPAEINESDEVADILQENEMESPIILDPGVALDQPAILASTGYYNEVDPAELAHIGVPSRHVHEARYASNIRMPDVHGAAAYQSCDGDDRPTGMVDQEYEDEHYTDDDAVSDADGWGRADD